MIENIGDQTEGCHGQYGSHASATTKCQQLDAVLSVNQVDWDACSYDTNGDVKIVLINKNRQEK